MFVQSFTFCDRTRWIVCYLCVLPVFVCVNCQSSDLRPVFSQLSVTHHGHHADDIDNRVLRAHPDLVLINSQHAVLKIETQKDTRNGTAAEKLTTGCLDI